MKKKGFSLIELLIVISIMAILASLALSAFSTARKQARDTQRKSDLTQYKTALESYYTAKNSYPVSASLISPDVSNGGVGESIFAANSTFSSSYMGSSVLQGVNPADGYLYYYISDGLNYKLWGVTELNSYFEICSSGKVGPLSTVPGNNLSCDL